MDVWLVSLEVDSVAILSPDEQERAARLRFEGNRIRWVRARSALRRVLAEATGQPADELEFVSGEKGKPSLSGGWGVEFNLSHSGEWAMIAVTRGVPVGIDIEQIRENVDIADLLRRIREPVLSEDRAALFGAWTRREARTKAFGTAFMDVPAFDCGICDLEAPPGYVAALALAGHDARVRRCGENRFF